MASSSKEILPLTSLRFFAASLVFCEHAQMIPGMEWFTTLSHWPGVAGVSLFFVLSGFILNYSYGQSNWTGAFGRTAREYYWGRVARIYPVHWLTFCLALPLGLHSNTARVRTGDLPFIFFLTDRMWPWYTAAAPPVKASWTLSVEALFYVLIPLLLLLLANRRRPLLTSIGILAVTSAFAIAAPLLLPQCNWSAYVHLPEFALGMVGYQWYRRGNLAPYSHWLALAGIVLIALATFGPTVSAGSNYLGYAPGALLLILGLAVIQGRVARFMSQSWLVLLGGASYALYLFHDPLLRYSKVFFNRRDIILSAPLNILTILALYGLCITVSVICFKFYETPMRRWIRALLGSRAKAAEYVPGDVPLQESVGAPAQALTPP